MSVDSDFDHFEVVFAHAAIGAFPIVGHILPFCAGRDVVFGPAFGFIVNVAAYNTFPAFHLIFTILVFQKHANIPLPGLNLEQLLQAIQ